MPLRTFAFAVGAIALLMSPPAAVAGPVKLDLMHGWKNIKGSPAAAISAYKGIVHLQGAITQASGTDTEPFVVPAAFRPQAEVILKVDLCNASNGRILINPDGTTAIDAQFDYSDAQCLTSLDGVTYALDGSSYKPLKLRNGWKPYGFETAPPAVHAVGSIVHLAGAMTGGKSGAAFVLPAALRPQASVYIPLDLVNASNGRLVVFPDGTVSVEGELSFQDAKNFTSLDGAFYSLDTTGFTPLALANGWTNQPSAAPAGVRLDHGVVEFQGAITAPTGSSVHPFQLPVGFRPSKGVYVAVDMCDATNGRLFVDPSGDVSVQAESDIDNATCFTSLEGVSFHL